MSTASTYGMTPAAYTKMLNNQAVQLYDRFTDTLRSLKEVTEPSARKLYLDDLTDLHAEAVTLSDTGLLTGQSHTKVNIIVSRPSTEWQTLAKYNSQPIVSLT